jgi:hypothetical protein
LVDEYEAGKAAMRAGLLADPPKSFQYLQLAAHYLDGKPADTMRTQELQPVIIARPCSCSLDHAPAPDDREAVVDPAGRSIPRAVEENDRD